MRVLPLILTTFTILSRVKLGSCWNAYYTTEIEDKGNARTDYIFGDCDLSKDVRLYTTVKYKSIDIRKRVIVRGLLNRVKRQPTCVILRSKPKEADTYPETPYNFQICVTRITYLFNKKRHLLFIHEWYIPPGFNTEGFDWELFFYGPRKPLKF